MLVIVIVLVIGAKRIFPTNQQVTTQLPLPLENPNTKSHSRSMGTVTKSSIGRGDSLKLFGCALAVNCNRRGLLRLGGSISHFSFGLVPGMDGGGIHCKIRTRFSRGGVLKRPPFLLFVVAWAFISALVWVLSWIYLSLTGWASAVLLESALGYFLAHKIFKAPCPWNIKSDLRKDLGL